MQTADDRPEIRHRYSPSVSGRWCKRCQLGPRARVHRVGSRCSMCFKYLPHYALDASRRCDECRP